MFPVLVFINNNKSIYKIHSVAANKNNDIYRKHFDIIFWSISPTVGWNIFGLLETIYNTIFRLINQVFDGMFDEIFIIETN